MASNLFPGVYGGASKSVIQLKQGDDIWNSLQTKPSIDSMHDGFICQECNSAKSILIDEDEVSCTACGTHLGYLIDSSAEYRWFGSDDRNPDPTRVGNPLNPLLPESSLGTRILTRPGDNKAMRRIRQYHLWTIMPYRERTLWTVFEMLQVRASNAGISSSIVDETKQLYAQVSPLCICRGQQKDALLAACLYESLKRHDTPRRPLEIAEIFQIDVKLITRGVKQFSGLLDEHLHTQQQQTPKPSMEASGEKEIMCNKSVASTTFRHYLEPAIYRLETPRSLHGAVLECAVKLGTCIDELGICPETTPSSLAASTLALTCVHLGIPKTNSEIAKVCSISSATLQKCLKRIENWKPILFKKAFEGK